MAGLADRRNALLGALVWWYVRRTVRRKTAAAVGRAPERRGWVKAAAGLVVLAGAVAGAIVAWRRLADGPDDDGWEPPPYEPPPRTPSPTPEAVAA